METIKKIVRTPENHEIRIKVPDHVPVNDPVEIIMFIRKKPKDYDEKINEIKKAMQDEHFLNDLKEVSEDFKNIDIEKWNE